MLMVQSTTLFDYYFNQIKFWRCQKKFSNKWSSGTIQTKRIRKAKRVGKFKTKI